MNLAVTTKENRSYHDWGVLMRFNVHSLNYLVAKDGEEANGLSSVLSLICPTPKHIDYNVSSLLVIEHVVFTLVALTQFPASLFHHVIVEIYSRKCWIFLYNTILSSGLLYTLLRWFLC